MNKSSLIVFQIWTNWYLQDTLVLESKYHCLHAREVQASAEWWWQLQAWLSQNRQKADRKFLDWSVHCGKQALPTPCHYPHHRLQCLSHVHGTHRRNCDQFARGNGQQQHETTGWDLQRGQDYFAESHRSHIYRLLQSKQSQTNRRKSNK